LGDVPTVSPQALWQMLYSDAPPLIVDVREPREFRRGHIPNARLISRHDLVEDLTQVPREKPVILVCQGGRRSSRATAMLCQQHYNNVQALEGGMIAWERERLLEAVEPR